MSFGYERTGWPEAFPAVTSAMNTMLQPGHAQRSGVVHVERAQYEEEGQIASSPKSISYQYLGSEPAAWALVAAPARLVEAAQSEVGDRGVGVLHHRLCVGPDPVHVVENAPGCSSGLIFGPCYAK